MQKNLWIISDVFIAGVLLFLVFSYLHKSNINNQNDYNIKNNIKEYYTYFNSKQYNKAIESAKKLNNFAKENNNDTLIAYSYDKIGDVYDKIENNDSALYYHKLAFDYWLKSGNKKFWSITYNQLGLNYLRKGDYNTAIDNFLKSLEYIDFYPIDRSYLYLMNLGCAYYQQGDYKEAINVFGESIKKYPPENTNDFSYINTLVNLALSYINIDDYNTSRKYLDEAYQIATKYNYKFSLGYILQSKAFYFYKQKNIDSAEYYYNKSFEIYKKLKYKAIYNEVKLKLSRIYIETNRPYKAKAYLDSTLVFFKNNFFNKGFLAENYKLFANYYLLIKNYGIALAYSDSSLSIANEINSLNTIKDIHFIRYQIFQQTNKLQLAIDELLKYNTAYQKLFNQISTNYIYGVEKGIEIHKKTSELEKSYIDKQTITHNLYLSYIIIGFVILLLIITSILLFKLKKSRKQVEEQKILVEEQNNKLSHQNDELKKQQEIAKELNDIKEMIIRIIGHDLRNPISLVYSYALLLKDKYDDQYLKERLNYISIAAINAIELLENLIDWSKMQANESLGKLEIVNTKDLLNEIINYYQPFILSKNITLNLDIIDNSISTNPNYMKTIIRNVLSNALKYTPENSKVTISSYQENDKLHVLIVDEGAGISSDVIDKIFQNGTVTSQKGTKGEIGIGMGYELIKYFLNKLQAELRFDKVDKGTSVTLIFPIQQT